MIITETLTLSLIIASHTPLCQHWMMDLGLSGKVALVTGSYRGTGSGVARVLAAEGAEVVVHGFEEGQADWLADELGSPVRAVSGDICTDEGAEAVAEQCGPVGHLGQQLRGSGGRHLGGRRHRRVGRRL